MNIEVKQHKSEPQAKSCLFYQVSTTHPLRQLYHQQIIIHLHLKIAIFRTYFKSNL